jgi:hypothetical protein
MSKCNGSAWRSAGGVMACNGGRIWQCLAGNVAILSVGSIWLNICHRLLAAINGGGSEMPVMAYLMRRNYPVNRGGWPLSG